MGSNCCSPKGAWIDRKLLQMLLFEWKMLFVRFSRSFQAKDKKFRGKIAFSIHKKASVYLKFASDCVTGH